MSNSTHLKDHNIIIITKARQTHSKDPHDHYKKPRPLIILLSLLAFIALLHLLIVTHQPNIAAPPTNCMGLISTTDYTQLVHLQTGSQEMQAVQVVNQLDGGQPASLVQVGSMNSQHTLDVYVYGCAMQKQHPRLKLLFTQRGLVQGAVTLSHANTLITSELDTTLSPEASAFLQATQENVYREYTWQNGAFAQVAYPGLYPVTSRSEAEALQQEANSGQSLPWTDPLATAEQMGKDIFKWPATSSQDTVVSNDGITAQAQLVQQNPQLQVTVTLKRLVQHDNKGIWFVTGAQTTGVTLEVGSKGQALSSQELAGQAQKLPQQVLKSPIIVQGTSVLADGQTTVALFDHTLTPISTSSSVLLHVNADGTYSGTLSYTNIASDQQGLLLIQSVPLPQNNSIETGQLLLVGVILG